MSLLLSRAFIVILAALTAAGCAESLPPSAIPPAVVTDSQLYELQKPEMGWAFYRLVRDTLMRAGNSAHPDRILVRYNAKAAAQLDSGGMVKGGTQFPDSSLIVKDVFTGSTRTIIAYMFKLRAAPNAGPGGWVWAETRDDGTPFIPASAQGAACAPCHSAGIDFTRMNDAHP